MTPLTESQIVLSKTRELCQSILSQPEYLALRGQVEAFMADPTAKGQFQVVVEKGEELHQKQHAGVSLSNEEIQDYEQQRQVLLLNPVARAFLDAREELGRLQDQVTRHVTKTLELGRVPEASDFGEGGCGAGCGCHH